MYGMCNEHPWIVVLVCVLANRFHVSISATLWTDFQEV
jgi:hypothetical protein